MKHIILIAAGIAGHAFAQGLATDPPATGISINGNTLTLSPSTTTGYWNAAKAPAHFENRSLVDGKLILQFRRTTPSNTMLLSLPPQIPPDRVEVWREVYGVSNGIVVLEKTEHAKVTPQRAVTEQEKVEWPK